MKILICESDPGHREGLQCLLSFMGYNVAVTQSGKEAIAISKRRNQPIDLLISELDLGDMPGTQVARKVSEAMPHVPVLFVSTRPLDSNSADARRRQRCPAAIDWLEKPFTVAALREKIGKLLRGFSKNHLMNRRLKRLPMAA